MATAPGSVRLLDRDVELGRLSALLAQAQAGRGAVAAIEGPAGIGKTALLTALNERAADRGVRALRARGRVLEAGMAFAVTRQLMEPVVLSASPADRRRLLAGPARFGAGALGLPQGSAPDSEFAAVHGLYWLLANLAERTPVLLTVDDVQWVDGPSLSWLAYLGPRTVELPVLVVVTAREGDPRTREPGVEAILADAGGQRFALPVLSPASAGTLVRRELGRTASPSFCAACWELTGGNPLYVRELLAAARNDRVSGGDADIPALRALASSAVGPSVLERLARMGPGAAELARAVAVLGSQHEVAIAAELAGLNLPEAELIADELAAAQILAPVRPLDYFHPLIGEAVYADIALGARRLAHRRAAAILDRTGATDSAAAHLLMTGPASDAWVTQRLIAAASNARERGAPEVAASYLRRALAEPPEEDQRPSILLRLGEAEWYAGQPTAIDQLEQAVAAARADPQMLAEAAGALANAYVLSDQTNLGVGVLQRAIDLIGALDPLLALRLDGASALAGVVDDRTAPAAHVIVDRLRPRLADLQDPPVRLLVVLAQVAMRRAEAGSEAEQMIDRALARQPDPPLNVCTSIIVTLIGIEAFGALQRLCEDMMTAARRRSALQEMIGIASFSSWVLLQMGELADAEAQARWALERATGIYAIDSLAHLTETLVERDELDAADAEMARMDAPLTTHSIMGVTYLMARGRLHAARQRAEAALQDFLACGERCEKLGVVLAMYHWRSGAALAHAALGHADEAAELAAQEVAIARAFGHPRALGVALHAAGLVAGNASGLALLEQAVTVLEGSRAPVELARATTEYGAALRRAGRRAEARTHLERGLDLAHHCGARLIARQARSELVAAGAKPRRDAVTGRDALTASELRVARLAAAGRTNRQIAQALFITTKTASAHLSRVYRKLDITRRDQLGQALIGAAPVHNEIS
jgi:DNA-binding CsgD family transcriptional regulator